MSQAALATSERFSRNQVRRILRLSERQLRAWERMGLIQPALSAVPAGKPASMPVATCESAVPPPTLEDSFYTFTDIVTLKTLADLRKSGVPPARLRRAGAALRERLTGVERPWSELHLQERGKKVIVHWGGSSMEPVTGQLLLDYETAERKSADAASRIETFSPYGARRKRTEIDKKTAAERLFMAGLRYEEEGASPEKAIRAYQKAIELNPQAAGAFINLGTVYYNLGQLDAAESCYRSALSIDPDYALVYFNLGNVADERNDLQTAREHYEEAIRRDPSYADPHYNLALVYEKLGRHGKARQQWALYLKLDRQSKWAAYARQQMQRTSLRIIPAPPLRPALRNATPSASQQLASQETEQSF